MATTAPNSTSCSSFWNFQPTKNNGRSRYRSSVSSSTKGGYRGYKKLDGVAMWVINGVTTAFFASLERCSCIRVNTVEDTDDINELSLIYNDGNTRYDGSSSKMRRRVQRGARGRAACDE